MSYTTLHKICIMGLFVALGVTLGFSFVHIPNVEFVTATIFLSGSILGTKEGLIIGVLTEALYSILNPLGMAAPPLMIAQVFSMGLSGAIGGIWRNQKSTSEFIYHLKLGILGLVTTLFFDVLTTLSFVWSIGFSVKNILNSLIVGVGFYVIHITSNVIIFMTFIPFILKAIGKSGVLAQGYTRKKKI